MASQYFLELSRLNHHYMEQPRRAVPTKIIFYFTTITLRYSSIPGPVNLTK